MTPGKALGGGTGTIQSTDQKLEMWGGVEYTRNRVHDRYFDQMELSGHAQRLDDYDRFAELGLRTLRVGMLWEQHTLDSFWHWMDERLTRLQELGIRPIVGFVHHGSGPFHTNLHDPEWGEKLAAYAREFSERYPWVDSYTPVNEPNTTARFSGMYGIWHPHGTSRAGYFRALLNQLKGVVLSMEAIRSVRPDARLILPDDVGNICGTNELRSTWELLNERQWLPFDLLCGRVGRAHPLFSHMQAEGIEEKDIHWFAEHACPPQVLGVNYYLTSDRFLDHRLHLYPENRLSAEGAFVDVEAVRVHPGGIVGVGSLLTKAWERFQIPVAVTEVHLGCTVDEQIRWLAESWKEAGHAQKSGVNCLAVTAWSLLGSFFWNELVTRDNGHYEPGAFDVRSGTPSRTELAAVVSQLAVGKWPSHPALRHAGWWQHPSRICFPLREEIAA